MAKKIFTLPWTMQELKTFTDGIVSSFSGGFLSWLNRMRTKPFVLVADEEQKVKRFFLTEEDAERYYQARADKAMTPEIEALNFTKGTVPGDEQYKMSFNVLNIDDSDTYGKTAKLRFSFATADTLNGNRPTEEPIEVYFTFTSDAGTKTDTKRFNYSEGVTEFDITEYLEPDTNEITMLVRGITSGLTLTAKATWTAVYLPFSSNFDITADRRVGTNFGIPYSVSGVGVKEVEFVLDSGTPFNDTVYDGTANKTYNYKNILNAGFHTLQMKAYTTVGNKRFESDMLYFEFIVGGDELDLTTTIIKAVFPSGTPYFMERNPGLIGEQYVDYSLQWAYFSTSNPNAIVMWKTKLNGVETVVGSREIDEMEGTVGIMPDPVKFQPDTVGLYDLYAYIKGHEDDYIGQYTINVIENTAGLREAEGYVMKLDAKGRSNSEPEDTRNDWSNGGFKTIFNDKMSFDGLAGYTGNAVRFDNGATGIITCKPFAVENAAITNGAAVVFNFRTFNVEDENAPLIKIGDESIPSTAYLCVYGKKIIFRPSNGQALTYEFASEEDTHLAIVVHPKTGVTDAQMMFFIFNGVEAPALPYGDTSVFNVGSYEDKDNTFGMIEIGNAEGKAAIDIYGIRVYGSMISMWQGMNNFMIDKGGDVAKMMRKNNLFINNDFNRPNVTKMKEQYRVLEVIGNLGLLESSNKKENFFGSVIYTDPFNPKFNFERKDGGAYIETAGQSRLEDLMAKSFHLDLNENDTVATYQDGKLCHKNRFIFAEGNIPENGVRIDLSGADSSMTRNASHMKMINKYCPYITLNGKYILRTPPQDYALSGKWSEDMAKAWGGDVKDYPWNFNINFAPDSVPIIVVWHLHEDDPIQVYGLAQMTEEKKASYANGNHSIYIKKPLADGTLDPFDRYAGEKGERGWNNEGVEEIEYVNPSDLTNNISTEGFDDETTRDYSFESCFPKKKDMPDGGAAMWRTFLTEFLQPITDTYGNFDAFNAICEDILYLPSFAFYYNKVMDKKMNDSLCRNMHVIRYNMGTVSNPKWQWWAKFWDADVCCGLFQSNAMGVDPETDRQTKDANGNYVMAGHAMWIWNALEKNEGFNSLCKQIAEASYAAGWSATTEKAEQDKISEGYSEGLYNLDGLLKFLYAYRKGNDYMVRMQGSSTPYRHGFIDASYAVREAQMAIGAYASRSASFRATNATYPSEVRITAAAPWRFGLGTTTTNIVTGVQKRPEDGEFAIQIPEGTTLGRDFLSVYGADKVRTLDVSDFAKYLSVQVNLGNLSQVQKLYVGYKTHERMAELGINQDTTVSFTGIEAMSRLMELSLAGLYGLQSFDLTKLNHLTHYMASATSLTSFKPADGTKFELVELPDTLQTVECRNVQIGEPTFWKTIFENREVTDYDEEGNIIKTEVRSVPVSVEKMNSCPTSLLTLSFIGMGNDEGAHNLLHQWLKMLRENEHLIQTAQITYRSIHWENVDKEDILTLTRIPKTQRNLSGYVFCNEAYTIEEMSALTNAFGEHVFDFAAQSTTLVCDCEGNGITVSATGNSVVIDEEGNITAEQGNVVAFSGAGFPISGSSAKNYRWRVWLDNQWYFGNDTMPIVSCGNGMTLNWLTGEFNSTESDVETKVLLIECYDNVSKVSGNVQLTVTPRSYPQHAEVSLLSAQQEPQVIDGVLNVVSRGSLLFGANHTPTGFTGTMADEGTAFTLEGFDERYMSRNSSIESNPSLQYGLDINDLPTEDIELVLKYVSKWKNGLQLTAEDIRLVVASVIDQLLVNDAVEGNPTLFRIMELAGVSHSATAYYNSMEVKALQGELNVTELLTEAGIDPKELKSFQSGIYNILYYLKNVTALDAHGTGVDDTVVIGNHPQITSVNLEDTFASISVGDAIE